MVIGSAEVKAIFGSGNRRAAGCVVTDGALRKGCIIEVGPRNGLRTCPNPFVSPGMLGHPPQTLHAGGATTH
jgi:hypothetical protein